MNAQTIGEIIQFILAPVVMISSCSIFVSGLLSRYAAINDRLRLMAHERRELLHTRQTADDPFVDERLSVIDWQIPDLLHRHKQAHDAVLLTYCAIFLFICDMFAIALLVVSGVAWLSGVVLVLFLGGMISLMLAILQTVTEVLHSHRSVRYEVERSGHMGGELR